VCWIGWVDECSHGLTLCCMQHACLACVCEMELAVLQTDGCMCVWVHCYCIASCLYTTPLSCTLPSSSSCLFQHHSASLISTSRTQRFEACVPHAGGRGGAVVSTCLLLVHSSECPSGRMPQVKPGLGGGQSTSEHWCDCIHPVASQKDFGWSSIKH